MVVTRDGQYVMVCDISSKIFTMVIICLFAIKTKEFCTVLSWQKDSALVVQKTTE